MGISAADGSVGVLPRPDKLNRSLMRLGIAGLGAFAALAGGCALGLGMASRTDFGSGFFAPADGWQVDAIAAGLAVALLAVFLVSVIAWHRMYRPLHRRTPRAREVLFIGLIPGLLLGALTYLPMGSAVSWASHHTTTWHRAEAEARLMDPTNPKAPPVPIPLGGTPASAALAVRMLHPSDLRGGWYAGGSPNPSEIPGGELGQVLSVRSALNQWHWNGTVWSPGGIAIESLRQFKTPAAAQAYLATFSQPQKYPGPRLGPTTHVRIGSVLVGERQQTSGLRIRSAAFAMGADEFSVTASGLAAPDFAALVKASVARATTGR